METYDNRPTNFDLIIIKDELIEFEHDWDCVTFFPTGLTYNICIN